MYIVQMTDMNAYMFRTFDIDGVPLLWMTASRELLATLGNLSKTTKRSFSVKGGSTPLRTFGQDDFLLRGGGGYPPNSAKENSVKKQVF